MLQAQILQVDEYGSIKSIKISNICGAKECDSSSFEIQNVKNALFLKNDQDPKILVEAFTSADFSINKILVDDPLEELQASEIKDLKIVRENNQI